MRGSDLRSCTRCAAAVELGRLQTHYRWHWLVEEGLEEPGGPFGFWDPEGRWNSTARAF